MTPENKIIKTPEEAIETIKSNMPTSGYQMLRESLAMAIEALEKVQHYQEMDKKLREAFGDCDGLLETVVDSLCRHEGEDIGSPVKSRLLTNETVDKWDAYLAIGTVEECREAKERQTPKRPVWKKGRSVICKDYADGHGEVEENKWADWVCPNCGWFVGEQYIPRRRNQQKSNYCSRCGQAIQWDKNLEETEDEL